MILSSSIDKVEKTYSKEADNLICKFEGGLISSVTRSSTSSALDTEYEEKKRKDELALK